MAYLVGFLIGCIVGIIIWWFVAKEFYNIAVKKGHTERKYFWWTFWLGVAGIFMVIALPDRGGDTAAPVVVDELPDL